MDVISDIDSGISTDKKRRGRRPKSEKPVSPETLKLNEEDAKCKKGRKPKYVYNSCDMNNIANSNSTLSDDENIIVKLNIQNNIFTDDEPPTFEEENPCAYNSRDYSNLSTITPGVESANKSEVQHKTQDNMEKKKGNIRVLELLKDFEEKNKNNEWPSNTSIACYWCCHKFNNAPFGIPLNFKNNKFEVFGCFCSLECAAAYNFKNNENVDEMWERYNLINLICRKTGHGNFVKPAPDVLSLTMFGGHLDIEKFREHFKTNKVININFPPMTSITQQLEEINENELNNEYKFIPIDNDRINKFKEKLVIKRSKPLVNTNSLENSMKLTYN